MDIWYELFGSDSEGTFTLQICKNLEEARKSKKEYIEQGVYSKYQLHIDKWRNKLDPTLILAIE